jgi:hypothetical protein
MATLLNALGMPRRRMVARFDQHPPGHVPVPHQLFAQRCARRRMVARLDLYPAADLPMA